MGGFESIDQAYIRSELTKFMPDTCTVTRRNQSQTKGDYVAGAATTVSTGTACRIMPLTDMGDEKSRLRVWPAQIVERAQYYITIAPGSTYKDGDVLTSGGRSYTLIAVRYDYGSYKVVVRALGVVLE